MKKSHGSIHQAVACLVLVAAGTVSAAEAPVAQAEHKAGEHAGMPHSKPVAWPAADLKWTENAEMKGIWQSVLWGDPKKGAYGALDKWAAGTTVAMHTHTHDSKGVVVSGTLSLTIDGKSTDLPPGSYVLVPGGHPHITKCNAGADCIFFLEQPGAGDLKLVEGKK